MSDRIRVLIADDHELVRMGFKSMLAYEGDIDVVGEAADGAEAVEVAQRLEPDVVVMDLLMPGVGGAEATRQIRIALPGTKVLIVTSYANSADIPLAVRNGATGVQPKECPSATLLAALRTVAAGGMSFADEVARQLDEQEEPIRLTDKQADVLESLTRGLNNTDIALMLGISRSAVKKHLEAIFRKLGVSCRSEAVAVALKRQMLKV